MRIVIAGAGVAGCIVARALRGIDGVDVQCLERVSAEDHSESGTGLNIGPNAVKALWQHDRALHDAVLAKSMRWKNWRTSLTDGTVLFDLPLARVADHDGIRIRWSELYSVLRFEARDLIRFGAAIETIGYQQNGTELFVDYRQHGMAQRIADVDLVIAGDGRYSSVRRTLSGAPAIHQHGIVIFRLLVPDTSGGRIDEYEQWFNGPNRLLAFKVPADSIYIAGSFPIPADAEIPEAAKHADALRALYTPASGKPSAQCAWLIGQICANKGQLHWARLQEAPPLYTDAKRHVLYLGDAAHAMVPTLGQGATQAIEDACAAASLLHKHLGQGAQAEAVPALLQRFEKLRASRIRFVIDFSNEATDTMRAGADPVAGTRKKMEAPFQAKLERLYRDVATG